MIETLRKAALAIALKIHERCITKTLLAESEEGMKGNHLLLAVIVRELIAIL